MQDITTRPTIQKRYDRIAGLYDLLESPMESRLAKWRRELLKNVSGRVLEVGVGTGKNLRYYHPDITEVVAIDFSANMLARARSKGQRTSIAFLQMDVQALAFKDSVFDYIVTSCVFCSVPDPIAGLKEMGRVCKKNGQILMLEHVKSQRKWLAALMNWLNPIPLHLYGANINRDTVENIRKAGFSAVEVTDLWLDIFKKIIITNR